MINNVIFITNQNTKYYAKNNFFFFKYKKSCQKDQIENIRKDTGVKIENN
jgi:hypothetical protein